MTVARNGISTKSGTVTKNYIKLNLWLSLNKVHKLTLV